MSFFKIAGMFGGGTIGVLAVCFFASNILNTGTTWLFGSLIGVFVIAGAIALIMGKM